MGGGVGEDRRGLDCIRWGYGDVGRMHGVEERTTKGGMGDQVLNREKESIHRYEHRHRAGQ